MSRPYLSNCPELAKTVDWRYFNDYIEIIFLQVKSEIPTWKVDFFEIEMLISTHYSLEYL